MTIKTRIFLAHASEDKPTVRKLHADLKERGFDPWLDEVDLIPGQVWKDEIPKAIADATIFLACLSAQSCDKVGYVQNEFRRALAAYGRRPPGSIYLIPVRLDECEVPDLRIPDLELGLKDIHWVDLWQKNGFGRLINTLERALGTTKDEQKEPSPAQSPPIVEAFRDLEEPWCPEMVTISEGHFLMGSPASEEWRNDDEGPQHEVTISRAFSLGRYPITFEEYDRFCEGADRKKPDDQDWGRGRRPVIHVNHEDAKAYCAWLSKVTEATYRLPTDAEWEYACRAGTITAYAFGNRISSDQAVFGGGAGKTAEVGVPPANPWGLRGMHGNIWEWCDDGMRKYAKAAVTDPRGRGAKRVMRGGSWHNDARYLRSAVRLAVDPSGRSNDIGFRCARILA